MASFRAWGHEMRTPWNLILVAALLASGCTGKREQEHEPAAQRRVDAEGRVVLGPRERTALGLETTAAVQGSLTTSDLRFGRVVARPQEDALVTAPVTGRLVAPTLALGATVEAGQVLLALEPLVDTASRATLEAQRRELAGQIEGARAQIEAKRADLTRITTLVSSGLATDADRAQAEAALTSEQARAESLRRASGELARMTGGRMELRAPVPGVVATLATEAGATIQQGTVVSRIVRAGPRWVDIAVPPGDGVGNGYRAQGAQGSVSLTLLSRGAVVQSDGTRRDRLEAVPEAAASLPPGATIAVEVLREASGVVMPASALVRRGREVVVFVEVETGTYELRGVQIAARDETRAVATAGLSAGDRVVTRGSSSLLGELGPGGGNQDRGAQE